MKKLESKQIYYGKKFRQFDGRLRSEILNIVLNAETGYI